MSKLKTNNKITLNNKTYLSVNKGVFNSELLDRNDFVRMNNKAYYASLTVSRIHADNGMNKYIVESEGITILYDGEQEITKAY